VSSLISDRATMQESRLSSVPSWLSANSSVRSWQRLVTVIALVGMLLAALAAGLVAPAAHGAVVPAATTTPHTAAIAPHIVCGGISLPC
jgi:hypothetical protein